MDLTTTGVNLRSLLDTCQNEHADDWIPLPGGGPGEHLLVSLQDVSSSDERPALAASYHYHQSAYMLDARLAVAWGMTDEDWRERYARQEEPPEWMPNSWKSVRRSYAHVLLNGTMVWQVLYGSVDWGAGISGIVPWPEPRFKEERDLSEVPEIDSWRTTTWEVRFALLLNYLANNRDFGFAHELEAAGIQADDIHPIDAARERLW